MALKPDSEFGSLLVPTQNRALNKTKNGYDVNADGYHYYVSGTSIFPMLAAQKSFYDWCVVLRDSERAAAQVGVEWAKAEAWLSDPRALRYMLDHAREEAEGSRITKAALDSLLSQGLYGEKQFSKNEVKLLELGLKRLGMLTDRTAISVDDGVEIMFAMKKSGGVQ